jgi:hypothetical protein
VTTLAYDQRLGDVLRMLPAARHLSRQGPVFIRCFDQYRTAMDCVTYARFTSQPVGEVLDRQIWPNRYDLFRASGMSWMDFVYDHPRLHGADRTLVLDNLPDGPPPGLPETYNLLCPHGISQGFRYPDDQILQAARHHLGSFVTLVMPPATRPGEWAAASVPDLARALRHAARVLCINSAPAILCSAVRRGRETFFLPQLGRWDQDNCDPWPGRIDCRI